jgi:hypothetical protein
MEIEGVKFLEDKEIRFLKFVDSLIKAEIISNKEEAIKSISEVIRGKVGKDIYQQIGFDNEMGIDVLLDSWLDIITSSEEFRKKLHYEKVIQRIGQEDEMVKKLKKINDDSDLRIKIFNRLCETYHYEKKNGKMTEKDYNFILNVVNLFKQKQNDRKIHYLYTIEKGGGHCDIDYFGEEGCCHTCPYTKLGCWCDTCTCHSCAFYDKSRKCIFYRRVVKWI